MGNALVTLVNPNKVHPGITPYALDILGTALEEAGFDVHVLDLTFRRHDWRRAVQDYFAAQSPVLVGVTIRNTDTIYPQEQRCFLDDHKEIIAEIKGNSQAPIIAGGVGFSSMPFALAEFFGIQFGVKGPGEIIICEVAERLYRGESADGVPGLIVVDHGRTRQVPDGPVPRRDRASSVHRSGPYRRVSGDPLKVDNLQYYARGGLGNILTKNGCPFICSHCVEPDAKGAVFARRDIAAVVDELEALTAQGVFDIHSSDSEFNLSIGNTKRLLREIIARKNRDRQSSLHGLRLWVYCQPLPFDAEFAELMAQAGCRGVNLSTDHVRDDILDGWKMSSDSRRFYSFDDVRRTCQLIQKNGMLVMIEAMIGMPGETIDTMRQCIDETLALNATVVGFTLGIRLFPYSPLGIRIAAQSAGITAVPGVQSNTATRPILIKPLEMCETVAEYERQFMFESDGGLRPLYYFSPELPEPEETIAAPNGRWLNTIRLMREHIPESEHFRVMLPTEPGISKDDNNYADNPFLLHLTGSGYKGAFWSHWRQRDAIMREGLET